MANDGILLESGTNEVEILEFVLGGQPFGVNVLKIQAIEQFDPARVTHIQLAHPSVIGTLLFRETCITLVDLTQEMEREDLAEYFDQDGITQAVDAVTTETLVKNTPVPADTSSKSPSGKAQEEPPVRLVLVMEFNDLKTAFLVDGVNRIHRMSWESINPLSAFLNTVDSKFTGSLQIEGREILLVDMEKVVTEILPRGLNINPVLEASSHPLAEARAALQIFLAEDSAIISAKVKSELTRGSYSQIKSFPNGRDCYEAVAALVDKAKAENRPITDFLGAIISDIEMPKMDGLALCKNVKQTLQVKGVPVIMFSSLINDQIARKCEDVDADDFISKPQFARLAELLDKHCLHRDQTTV